MDWAKELQQPKYWLLAIGTALITLNLTVLLESDNYDLQSITILLWLAIVSFIWEKKDSLKLQSDIIPTIIGCGLMGVVLIRTISNAGYHLYFSPLMSFIALCLLASGFKGLNQYLKEIMILSLLVFSPILASILRGLDLPLLTAKFSATILSFMGFEILRQGTLIRLPGGGVEVYGACSGVESITQMFTISVLFFLMIPITNIQKVICIIFAILLGFMVNSGRVALLAILVSGSRIQEFKFWHEGNGTLIFSIISVVLFGAFAWLAFLRTPKVNSDIQDS